MCAIYNDKKIKACGDKKDKRGTFQIVVVRHCERSELVLSAAEVAIRSYKLRVTSYELLSQHRDTENTEFHRESLVSQSFMSQSLVSQSIVSQSLMSQSLTSQIAQSHISLRYS